MGNNDEEKDEWKSDDGWGDSSAGNDNNNNNGNSNYNIYNGGGFL